MSRGRHPLPRLSGKGTLPEPFNLLVTDAVRQMLAKPDVDAFLEWMRREGPKRHPGVFAGVPAPELWPSFATNLGIGLWNVMPFPGKGFRLDPLPAQTASDPCRCRSGKTYGLCCAHMPAPPSFAAALWPMMLQELDDEGLIAAATSLRMPGNFLLELAHHWNVAQLHKLVLKLLQPVFRKLPKVLAAEPPPGEPDEPIRKHLKPLTKIFVDSLMEGGTPTQERRWRKRLLEELPEELHRTVKVLGV